MKSDYYMTIGDVVETTENEKDILIDELYLMFKSWYKDTQGETKCLVERFEGLYGEEIWSYKKGWTNMRIRIDDDEECEIS